MSRPRSSLAPADALALFLLLLLALWTAHGFLHGDRFPGGHDQEAHMVRLAAFDVAVRDGQLPPLWAGDYFYGYGGPVFAFYPTLLYYVAEPLALGGVDVLWTWRIILVALTVATAWLMYGWMRGWWGRPGAFVAAAAVTLAPYHILDLYVRAAYTEYAAFACAIVMLWSAGRWMAAGTRGAWFTLVLSTAAMVGLHLGSVLMMGPLTAGWIALHAVGRRERLRRAALGWGALLVALAVTVFDWLPAAAEKGALHIDARTLGGYFTYTNHFLTLTDLVKPGWGFGISRPDATEHTSFQLGLVQWAGIAAGLALLLRRDLRRPAGVLLALCGVSLVMTLRVSAPLWSSASLLQTLQFPWRFLMPATLAASALVGAPLALLSGRRVGWSLAAAGAVVAVLAFAYGRYLIAGYHYQRVPPTSRALLLSLRDTGIGQIEYLPHGMPWQPRHEPPQPVLAPAPAHVAITRALGHRLEFTVDSPQPTAVAVERFAVPGWRASVDGTPAGIEHDPRRETVVIEVPAGRHAVAVVYGLTPLRRWTLLIALFVLAVLAVLWRAWPRLERRAGRELPEAAAAGSIAT